MNASCTVTEHRNALLNAIYADPLGQLPRLMLADHLEECSETRQAGVVRSQPHWPLTEAQFKRLESQLQDANGRRRVRTLSLEQCVRCAIRAVDDDDDGGWYAVGGGTVANAYKYPAERTVCVAARKTRGGVRIGVARGNAKKGSSLTSPVTGLRKDAQPEAFTAWADAE